MVRRVELGMATSRTADDIGHVEKVDPTRYKHGLGSALRLTGFLGFCAGFMLAYQQSSCTLYLLTPQDTD
jgi:hypothetical protein